MAFRTILIEKARRVNLDLNSIIVNYDENDFNINLDEINIIIFDDPMCLISLKLLSKLCEKGISVIFTDHSHNPVGTLLTLQKHSRASKRLKQQINWSEEKKIYVWNLTVENKIQNQMQTLIKLNKKNKIGLLDICKKSIVENDITNREGLASRIYFKELFSNEFKRFNDDIINYCLNFIYQIIRSKISQEIVSLGYNTELGINHKSEYNSFNLSDDLIEPYRPIVDYYIYQILDNNMEDYLTPQLKREIINILNYEIAFNNQKIKIGTSIQFYVQEIMSFMDNETDKELIFPSLL